MVNQKSSKYYFSIPDLVILMCVATTIYGVVAIAQQWSADFRPVTEINLSGWSLPYYTLLSGIRGFVAYGISLAFTLTVGYFAAHSPRAERWIIPLLDILQSIPVLGFLPGLVIGLVALFPNTNIGLELAAILMIFTGQVWNMTFSFYSSLKSVPTEFEEAATIMNLGRFQKLLRMELPFSAVNLAWNSLLSMAGGWFFLIPCEAMTLGDREYRLPGIGSYMDVAVKQGDTRAMTLAIIAMIGLIVASDFLVWRPILAWVRKFRLEDIPGSEAPEPLMQIWIRESLLIRWVSNHVRRLLTLRRAKKMETSEVLPAPAEDTAWIKAHPATHLSRQLGRKIKGRKSLILKALVIGLYIAIALLAFLGASRLIGILSMVKVSTWLLLMRDTFWTFLRVSLAVVLGTLWTVPVGIWISTSPRRARIAQPIIQIVASFPAPMLYPLAIALFFKLGISFDWGSMFLIMLGTQWYILFNVMAGAMRISAELRSALALMKTSRWEVWKNLYLPSIFPNLVTGWITASGGAWNASVVAEYLYYQGEVLKTGGLGATLSIATVDEDFTLLAASLTVMVVVVVALNRTLWAKLNQIAYARYRLEVI